MESKEIILWHIWVNNIIIIRWVCLLPTSSDKIYLPEVVNCISEGILVNLFMIEPVAMREQIDHDLDLVRSELVQF